MNLHSHIRNLEEHLLQPEVRSSREKLNELIADQFIEYGSSGRLFTRQQILNNLPQESSVRRSIERFDIVQLADEVVLAIYLVATYTEGDVEPIHSNRSSIWKLIENRWQIVFHQGTITKV